MAALEGGNPFDFAQDEPFDFAQDEPFDFAQDRPLPPNVSSPAARRDSRPPIVDEDGPKGLPPSLPLRQA